MILKRQKTVQRQTILKRRWTPDLLITQHLEFYFKVFINMVHYYSVLISSSITVFNKSINSFSLTKRFEINNHLLMVTNKHLLYSSLLPSNLKLFRELRQIDQYQV